MDASVIRIIITLIFLECILSIDNAAVLGAMVAPLPDDQPVPWPGRLRRILRPLDRILGPQRQAALKVGLLGAYAGRIMMLLLASLIIQNIWMQVVGAIYLIYLAVKHFGENYHQTAEQTQQRAIKRVAGGFWSVVLTIELADLAFSLDNVVAAVALSDRLWVVILGVAIGIVVMRFAATIFTRLIEWEPALEQAAYLLLLVIGGELLVKHYFHIDLNEWTKFGISIGVILVVVAFARSRLLHPLLIAFRPFLVLFALTNDAIDAVLRFVLAPFRRGAAHEAIEEQPASSSAAIQPTTSSRWSARDEH